MNIKTIIQALYYLINSNDKKYDKLSLLKLVFFADRYHMRKYARSITDDTYYAMQYGPVASNVKNILDFDFLSEDEKNYIEKYLSKDGKYYSTTNHLESLEMLSDTDKEALDFAIENFAHNKTFDLVDMTHNYPEWKRFEKSLEDGLKREKMNMEDFFLPSMVENDPYDVISQEIVDMSRDFYMGRF